MKSYSFLHVDFIETVKIIAKFFGENPTFMNFEKLTFMKNFFYAGSGFILGCMFLTIFFQITRKF